ncbi:hypothetical protein [Jannaschia sp. CCS1]|uniref:hypothetical protein n=1 Tax=Jannaschia sp. (strain CCS1) TaxID=290400 RepID=UPI000053B7E9|nr:hypothetical protein [Jannaschia sp. CCS1]ABD52980.1 hypothetical protein Jann_0063 [Jannaschia sp. CCS1]
MRTSRRLRRGALLLGPAALLAACVGLGGGDDAPREVQVTADAVTITGPRGFCVDPTAVRNTDDTGFVLLGNCAAISGSARAGQPDVPAVLTAAVSAPSSGGGLTANLDALETFFQSDDGRALLSRSGDASTVQILDTRRQAGMFLLHARDSSAGEVVGVASDYWRAYLDVGTRLATLSVLALEDAEVSNAQVLSTLTQFATAVQAANPVVGAAELPQGTAEEVTPPFREGLFARIFQ